MSKREQQTLQQVVVCPNSTGHCTTLGAALRKVSPGGTIFLKPGRYILHGQIRHSVSIHTLGKTNDDVHVGVKRSETRILKDINVDLYGLTVVSFDSAKDWLPKRRSTETLEDDGRKGLILSIEGNARLTASKCVFRNKKGRILAVKDRAQIDLKECLLDDCVDHALMIVDKGTAHLRNTTVCGESFYAEYAPAVSAGGQALILEGCVFRGNECGDVLIRNGHAEIQNCRFGDSSILSLETFSLRVEGSATATINTCTFCSTNGTGLWTAEHASAEVHHSKFEGNETGLLVANNSEVRVTNSSFRGNSLRGIAIETAQTTVLRSCAFSGNGHHDVFAEDGQLQLTDCTWELGEPDQVGLHAVRRASVAARKCRFTGGSPAYVKSGAKITFSGCDFNELLDSLFVQQSDVRLIECSWSGTESPAITVDDGSLTVENCSFAHFPKGIHVIAESAICMEMTRLSSIGDTGIEAAGCSSVSLSNCDLSNIGRTAVALSEAAALTATRCSFSSTPIGLSVFENASSQAKGCDFRGLEGRAYQEALSAMALNSLAEHLVFENCTF